MTAILKALPHNIEAEMALLGILLFNPATAADVEGRVAASEFYEHVNAVAFAAAQDLARSGALSAPAVHDRLMRNFSTGWNPEHGPNPYERLGGIEYLAMLIDRATGGGKEAMQYAGLIRDAATRRDLIHLADTLREEAGASGGIDQLISRAEWRLRDISRAGGAGDHWHDGRYLGQVVRDKIAGNRRSSYISTGFPGLDRKLGGIRRGRVTVIAGRPSMGKSAVGLEICRNVAGSLTEVKTQTKAGIRTDYLPTGVGLFSLEMDEEEVALRLGCAASFDINSRSGPVYFDVQTDQLRHDDGETLGRGADLLDALPFHFDQRPRLTVAQIVPAAKRLIRTWEKSGIAPGFIMVDHLHLVKPEDERYGNRAVEIGQVMGALDELAKETGVAVVILCQVNRENVSRQNADKRPQLSDLKGSGDIEQDANTVIFLHRPEYYLVEPEDKDNDKEMMEYMDQKMKWEGIIQFLVRKNRGGRNNFDYAMQISLPHNALWEMAA